jgi:rhamnose transport system permease protein
VYAMGNNIVTSRYSGLKVDRIKIIIFTLNGLFAAIAGIFLTSKMGSARPSIALGYELDVIAMVVLGGVSTAGGKGRVGGTVLSIFIIGLLRYGLGLINVPSQSIMIILGALLVVAVAIPNLKESFSGFRNSNLFLKKESQN